MRNSDNFFKMLSRSGSEEQYTDLMRMLDDVEAYVEDLNRAKSSKKKDKEEKAVGAAMRDKAMETLKQSIKIFLY